MKARMSLRLHVHEFTCQYFAQENRRWMREQQCLGKNGRFFWLQLSVNISSVCLRSLRKINILHIEHIIILVRPGHCMIACEHVFRLHAWPTGRDHPYKEPLQAVGCVLLVITLWASQPRLHQSPLTLPYVAHLAFPKNYKYMFTLR